MKHFRISREENSVHPKHFSLYVITFKGDYYDWRSTDNFYEFQRSSRKTSFIRGNLEIFLLQLKLSVTFYALHTTIKGWLYKKQGAAFNYVVIALLTQHSKYFSLGELNL